MTTNISETLMRSWGWSEETIAWEQTSQRLLVALPDHERGWYEGVVESFCYANGLQENGVSSHRLPVDSTSMREDRFDFRTLLAVLADLDDEGHIFLPGYQQLTTPWGGDDFLFLHCTEAIHSVGDPTTVYPNVAWGYRDAYKVWEEAHA